MTRAQPRIHLHSSRLIRFLTDLSLVDAVAPENTFAEKLGLWVDFTDAIALSSVHAASTHRVASSTQAGAGDALRSELAQMRTAFAQSIRRPLAPQPTQKPSHQRSGHVLDRARITWPESPVEIPLNVTATFEPYRRFYGAHQRDLELKIRTLRARARELLAHASPALQKLAALDGALDAILQEREGMLLATVPLLLKKRYAQLFAAHQSNLAPTQTADDPATWMQTGAWLARFCDELETMLLAEWDVRLEPTLGLIEALHNETSNSP